MIRNYLKQRAILLTPYWRWWVTELLALTPASVRTRLSPPPTLVRIGGDEAGLHLGNRSETERESAVASVAGSRYSAVNDLQDLPREGKVVALLPDDDLFVFDLAMPRGTLNDIDNALSFQLLRESPLSPEALCWTRCVERVDKDYIHLSICAARRADVDNIANQFIAIGSPRPAIGFLAPDGIRIVARGDPIVVTEMSRLNRRSMMLAACLLASIPISSVALIALQRNATEGKVAELAVGASERARKIARLRSAAHSADGIRRLAAYPSVTSTAARLAETVPPDVRVEAIRTSVTGKSEAEITTVSALAPDIIIIREAGQVDTGPRRLVVEIAP